MCSGNQQVFDSSLTINNITSNIKERIALWSSLRIILICITVLCECIDFHKTYRENRETWLHFFWNVNNYCYVSRKWVPVLLLFLTVFFMVDGCWCFRTLHTGSCPQDYLLNLTWWKQLKTRATLPKIQISQSSIIIWLRPWKNHSRYDRKTRTVKSRPIAHGRLAFRAPLTRGWAIARELILTTQLMKKKCDHHWAFLIQCQSTCT